MSVVTLPEQQDIGQIIQFRRKAKMTLGNEKKNIPPRPKMTPNNSHKETPHEVYPLKNKEDIDKMINYFCLQITNTNDQENKQIAFRNLMMFVVGINIGLRASDLLKLRWSDIYNADETFKDGIRIQEKKTKKYKTFSLNESCRHIIQEYVSRLKINIKKDNYIFYSRETKSPHIEVKTASKIIKKAADACDIKFNVGTHTLRKTYAYQQIMENINDAMFIADLMDLLNQVSIKSTLHYAGISDEERKKYNDKLNLGLNTLIKIF
jgi:integrase